MLSEIDLRGWTLYRISFVPISYCIIDIIATTLEFPHHIMLALTLLSVFFYYKRQANAPSIKYKVTQNTFQIKIQKWKEIISNGPHITFLWQAACVRTLTSMYKCKHQPHSWEVTSSAKPGIWPIRNQMPFIEMFNNYSGFTLIDTAYYLSWRNDHNFINLAKSFVKKKKSETVDTFQISDSVFFPSHSCKILACIC